MDTQENLPNPKPGDARKIWELTKTVAVIRRQALSGYHHCLSCARRCAGFGIPRAHVEFNELYFHGYKQESIALLMNMLKHGGFNVLGCENNTIEFSWGDRGLLLPPEKNND